MSDSAKTLVKAGKAASERILAFDILRGYFLLVILFNHLYFYPSGLELFTGRSHLYVSTAEGFFVVSGIVLGIVRGRKLLEKPFKLAAGLLLKRSFQLYITSIILTVLFTFIGQFFLDNPGLKTTIFNSIGGSWYDFIWQTLTLGYSYGWADFLKLYAVFLLFSPIALWLLRKGWWYILLALSTAVWALYPLFEGTPYSQMISWQLVFFSGFIIGYYWSFIVAKWRSLSTKTRKLIGWSLVGIFAVTAVATFTLVFGYKLGGSIGPEIKAIHNVVEQNFHKNQLPVPRLILGAVWFWAMFFLVRRFEGWLLRHFGKYLLEYGRNSLYIYTISAFVVFFIHLIVPAPGFDHIILNLLASIIVLGLVHLALETKFLMKIIPR